ncbi:hypothetical protein X943_000275 [Babesia divergens]|uniref:Uncharacterized protein n=1 Tax=Babesia divergens TaxID=32595 RepID=A0AAD9LLP5_BABDI|nr:hypothetical protein X943_000275 [Babesia divergens]
MRLLLLVLWIFVNAFAVERRDNSLLSSFVRYVAQRSTYKQGDQEYARVTQAPVVKVHLHKVMLPTALHSSLKSDLGGASEVEHENSRSRNDIAAINESLDELETLSGVPLQRFNSHNYSEREFQAAFPTQSGVRRHYTGIMNNPIGLSDYAMLSAGPMSNRPNGYIFSERRKRKPSELEMQDAERVHVPNFPDRGDSPIEPMMA